MQTICVGCGTVLTNENGERVKSAYFIGYAPKPTKDVVFAYCEKCTKKKLDKKEKI